MSSSDAWLSVVIPSYNEENMISEITKRIKKILSDADICYELLFIDDGSIDKTWEAIKNVVSENKNIVGIRFSRNFGKEAAIFAGLEKAQGNCCIVIDCDLQHPPEKIVEMYHLWQEGYEVIEGIKEERGIESKPHKFAARCFYSLISKAVGFDMSNSSDFILLDRKVIDTLNKMPERGVFFRALSYWVGFKKAEVYYQVQERKSGTSKWSTYSLIRYAIRNICSFSSGPLQVVTFFGIVMLLTALIFSTIALIQKILGIAIGGFTTVIVLLLFCNSLIMISLGVVGYYLARIFDELKGRPRYIIASVYKTDSVPDEP